MATDAAATHATITRKHERIRMRFIGLLPLREMIRELLVGATVHPPGGGPPDSDLSW
jgi:hypothetical protein